MLNIANNVTLKDGRKLAYAQYGDLHGTPVFFIHGWPSCRFAGLSLHTVAKKLKIRIIAPDRPGVGGSDFKEGRALLDFPDDIAELVHKLNIQKFSVMGVSGGGPYAAACAYKIPKKIKRVAIVVGLAPPYVKNICNGMALFNKLSWENYGRIPLLKELAGVSIVIQNKLSFLQVNFGFRSKSDHKLYKKIAHKEITRNVSEALRGGTRGLVQDLTLYTSDWGFCVNDITIPVCLYYGIFDKNVSIRMGEYYHKKIKGSSLTVYKGGHLSWLTHSEAILKSLVT